jgi:catechol 2,3-dioxygenase
MSANHNQADWTLDASLHHLALNSENPEALARFYAQSLGLQISRLGDGWQGQGRERQLIFLPGKSKTLAHAAFAVSAPEMLHALKLRLTDQGWSYQDAAALGLQDGAISAKDPDGNLIIFGLPTAAPRAEFVDKVANRPARLQHVVMASTQARVLTRFFQTHFGFVLSDDVVDDAGTFGRHFCVAATSITTLRYSRPAKTGSIITAMRRVTGG